MAGVKCPNSIMSTSSIGLNMLAMGCSTISRPIIEMISTMMYQCQEEQLL